MDSKVTRDADIFGAASRLARSAKLTEPIAVERLPGGRNNRVYRVDLEDGGAAVLKHYHTDPRDTRDRLGAEWSYVTYVWARGVRRVPAPLAFERKTRTALYGYAAGRKLTPGEISASHIEAAIEFILASNSAPRRPDELAPASESCFSLASHLATVDRRIARLSELDPKAPAIESVRLFVKDKLRPAWHQIRAGIEREMRTDGIQPDKMIGPGEVCVSPSDFGFHNVLVDAAGKITFLDFEYAGQDDPAKLVCDFFCSPDVPVGYEYWSAFVDPHADGHQLAHDFHRRCRLLLDAYRIKCTCIILNEFLPIGAARRAFAMSVPPSESYAAQLEKAEAKLAELGHQ
jgi:hypothetical protein